MVARLQASDAFADFDDDTCAFMAQYNREQTFRIIARKGEGIGVADTGVGDLDQHFTLARRRDINLDNLKGFTRFECNCGTRFHMVSPKGSAY
jgi:hypothetical protein